MRSRGSFGGRSDLLSVRMLIMAMRAAIASKEKHFVIHAGNNFSYGPKAQFSTIDEIHPPGNPVYTSLMKYPPMATP